VFLTTHYLDEADSVCDRVMIIDRGRIVAAGAPQDLKRQAAGDSVALSVAGEDQPGRRALALLSQTSFVREVTADGDDLRL
jgi:ABC-2 type transport system ATP-binding protein